MKYVVIIIFLLYLIKQCLLYFQLRYLNLKCMQLKRLLVFIFHQINGLKMSYFQVAKLFGYLQCISKQERLSSQNDVIMKFV